MGWYVPAMLSDHVTARKRDEKWRGPAVLILLCGAALFFWLSYTIHARQIAFREDAIKTRVTITKVEDSGTCRITDFCNDMDYGVLMAEYSYKDVRGQTHTQTLRHRGRDELDRSIRRLGSQHDFYYLRDHSDAIATSNPGFEQRYAIIIKYGSVLAALVMLYRAFMTHMKLEPEPSPRLGFFDYDGGD